MKKNMLFFALFVCIGTQASTAIPLFQCQSVEYENILVDVYQEKLNYTIKIFIDDKNSIEVMATELDWNAPFAIGGSSLQRDFHFWIQDNGKKMLGEMTFLPWILPESSLELKCL